MKLNTKHLFFSLAFVFVGLFLAQTTQAQAVNSPWNWKKYKIKWKMPAGWRVKDKGGSSGKFTASGNRISFRLKPWRDASATAKQVAMSAYRSTTSVKGKKILNQKYLTTKHGLKKYIILAEGYQYNKSTRKNRKVRIGIMGFINPKSPVNLYCRFLWWKSDDATASPLSYKIAQTFDSF